MSIQVLRKTKKILAMVLAFALVFSMTAPTITVEAAKKKTVAVK